MNLIISYLSTRLIFFRRW